MPAGNDGNAAVKPFFDAARRILGEDRVFAADVDRDAYADQMAFDLATHKPSGAVCAQSVDEVQQILREANRHRVPVWPISRGKNFGYGGSAPVQPGTVVLDLSRMNRIHEINVELGYCVVEPGVGFYDLFDKLSEMGNPLWMSVPGNSWGSVAGNALERGVGPQPYGDHAAQICGMEVVLPDSSLVRTGAGAMTGNPAWHVTKNSYGPGWDQMFCQSNFGVVTRLGLWLMPPPQSTMSLSLRMEAPDDIERGVRLFARLRSQGLVDNDPAWLSYVGIATQSGARSSFWEGEGLLPEAEGAKIRKTLGIGWWNARISLYGFQEVLAVRARLIDAEVRAAGIAPGQWQTWLQGEPLTKSATGIPMTRGMMMIDWYGGRGGHLGFSPVLPADPKLAATQFRRTRARFEEFGIDYYGAFGVGSRQIVSVNEILYNRDDEGQKRRVNALFEALVQDAHAAGHGEYRTHLDFMDAVAGTFDFNNHALRRLNEKIKDTLDPAGILAPGKSGIWPKGRRPYTGQAS